MVKVREAITTNGKAAFYASIWDDLRQAAMDVGWSLGLHGSLASDMDIMAMAWTEDAVPALEMILRLKMCFDKPNGIHVTEAKMPNNRTVYTLSIWADFYLDINIISTQFTPPTEGFMDMAIRMLKSYKEADPEKFPYMIIRAETIQELLTNIENKHK